jgi:glycosyltransferase involved in cell wall biosynthesis
MRTDISVITCAHNPRTDYLKQVLEALSNQTLDKEAWEYLLVDNASDELLASHFNLSWHPRARHVREMKLGLTHARLRGIRESRGVLLVFVDDDNVLDTDYLERTLRLSQEWPLLGAWGGQVRAEFETIPREWTRKYWSRLVIREFDQDRWSNLPYLHDTMPSGAGLCVRRCVAECYFEYHKNGRRPLMMDRTGNSLLSGGDTDLAATACDIGLGTGLFSSLKLTHLIPRERLEEDYLAKLLEGLAFSGVVFNSFRANGSTNKTISLKSRIGDVLRLSLMDRRERRFFRAIRRGEARAAQFLSARH